MLKKQAIEWAHEIAQSAPLSLAAIKAVIRETDQMDLESAYETMRSGQIKAYHKCSNLRMPKRGHLLFLKSVLPNGKGNRSTLILSTLGKIDVCII